MSRSIVVELRLPGDLGRLTMPPALRARLQGLLDRQDLDGRLCARERREAQALAEVADLLSLLRLRATRPAGPRRS